MANKQPYIKPVIAGEEKLTLEEAKSSTETNEGTAATNVEVIPSTETNEEASAGTIAHSATAPVGIAAQPVELVATKVVKQENSNVAIPSKEISGLMNRVNATNNQVVINAMNAVQQYMQDMGPAMTQTTESGARHQVVLFRAIRTIIDYSHDDFQLAFATLLRLFDENKDGVFHERYVFRFMESVVLNQDERRAFERILNLIKLAAASAGRKEAVNQINFQKTLQYVFTEEGRQRVLAFFNK